MRGRILRIARGVEPLPHGPRTNRGALSLPCKHGLGGWGAGGERGRPLLEPSARATRPVPSDASRRPAQPDGRCSPSCTSKVSATASAIRTAPAPTGCPLAFRQARMRSATPARPARRQQGDGRPDREGHGQRDRPRPTSPSRLRLRRRPAPGLRTACTRRRRPGRARSRHAPGPPGAAGSRKRPLEHILQPRDHHRDANR